MIVNISIVSNMYS